MPIVRILLILLALAAPALAQDGARDAVAAREAAQAFRVYVEGVAKEGGRPDLTRPEVAAQLGRVFNIDAFNALPPAQASDLDWLLDWMDAANSVNKLFTRYGSKPGPQPDLEALTRNMSAYEDQFAEAMNFMIRGYARQAVASKLFKASLTPAQFTPVRERGFRGRPQQRCRVHPGHRLRGGRGQLQAGQRPPGGGRDPRHARGLGGLFPAAGSGHRDRTTRRLCAESIGRDSARRSHSLHRSTSGREYLMSCGLRRRRKPESEISAIVAHENRSDYRRLPHPRGHHMFLVGKWRQVDG